jgi:anti-sigma factor RsiW
MNSDTQLKVMAYLDKELSPGEARKIAGLISSDREVQELYAQLRAGRELLSPNEPEIKLPESRDFYWSKIKRQIESSEREPAPETVRPWWIRLIAPLAGTAALFALLISVMTPGGTRIAEGTRELTSITAPGPLHGEVEDLAPELSSVTFRSEEDGVTVVWLTARE